MVNTSWVCTMLESNCRRFAYKRPEEPERVPCLFCMLLNAEALNNWRANCESCNQIALSFEY
jgi:hypothetical protein